MSVLEIVNLIYRSIASISQKKKEKKKKEEVFLAFCLS
jgi:hypothetical protein